MNYKSMYHVMNSRRKIEIDLCKKTIYTAIKLYENIIIIDNEYDNKSISEICVLCSNMCSILEDTYQALLETDTIIEKMRMDEDINTTIIYPFESFDKNKKNNTDN